MCCICKIGCARAKAPSMKYIYVLTASALFTLSACGGQSGKPQSASATPAAKPMAKPVAKPAAKPTTKPKTSLPAPRSASGSTGAKPTLPAPRQPGTISFERRVSGGVAGDMLGRTEKSLRAQYGDPRLDISEGDGRKLQYVTKKCVVDIYLYPPAAGKDAQVVHIDARDDAGRDLDRDGCIQQLSRK